MQARPIFMKHFTKDLEGTLTKAGKHLCFVLLINQLLKHKDDFQGTCGRRARDARRRRAASPPRPRTDPAHRTRRRRPPRHRRPRRLGQMVGAAVRCKKQQ